MIAGSGSVSFWMPSPAAFGRECPFKTQFAFDLQGQRVDPTRVNAPMKHVAYCLCVFAPMRVWQCIRKWIWTFDIAFPAHLNQFGSESLDMPLRIICSPDWPAGYICTIHKVGEYGVLRKVSEFLGTWWHKDAKPLLPVPGTIADLVSFHLTYV